MGMRSEIDADKIMEYIVKGLEAEFGGDYDLSDVEYFLKRPRGAKTEIGAKFYIEPKKKDSAAPTLSAVGES